MSLYKRRAFFVLGAGLVLGACGFTPVRGPSGSGNALQGAILADAPNDRQDYAFVARFEDRLGRAESPRWALAYDVDLRRIGVGVSPENETTRYNVTGQLRWSLRPIGGGDPVLSGTLDNFTSYSATGTTVATLTARRDAEDRLMVTFADQLIMRLYSASNGLAP